MLDISTDEALELLRRAVNEKGADYRDPNAVKGYGCYYFEPDEEGSGVQYDKPCCIVGHVMHYLDFQIEPTNNAQPVSQLDYFPWVVTNMFANAQGVQDQGGTWGEALLAAQEARQAARNA